MKITDKNGTLVPFVFLFVLILAFSCSQPADKDNNKKRKASEIISVQPFRIDSLKGWGYEIVLGNKVYIHQENIPALEGNRVFTSREDAMKTGNLVREKMIANKPPTLSKEEVISLLGISE